MENTHTTHHYTLLQSLNLPDLPYLGEGMQCMVFAKSPDQVLKIYNPESGLENLNRLMAFYQSFDTQWVDFTTPEILSIHTTHNKILVTEKRLHGISPTLDYLQHLQVDELEIFFQHYVDALFQIQNIDTHYLSPGEPLDLSGDFVQYGQYGSWQSLLIENLQRKIKASGSYYLSFLPDLESVVEALYQKIPALPNDINRLIHGDFYPANTLMDESFNIKAVLDFGTYTLVGDPIYDMALGWIFADMYQNVKQLQAVDFVGELIRERLSVEEFRRMKLYILIYSLLSADIYSDPGDPDGHFQWAMNNLNNDDFREVL